MKAGWRGAWLDHKAVNSDLRTLLAMSVSLARLIVSGGLGYSLQHPAVARTVAMGEPGEHERQPPPAAALPCQSLVSGAQQQPQQQTQPQQQQQQPPPAAAPPCRSLVEGALLVLSEPDPWRKAELTERVARAWRDGSLHEVWHDAGSPPPLPPDKPARDTSLSLLEPHMTPRLGKGGTLASRQARTHHILRVGGGVCSCTGACQRPHAGCP